MIPIRKIFLILIFFTPFLYSQSLEIAKIEPPNWWAGMKYDSIQVMVYGKNLNDISVESSSKSIHITGIHNAESSSYCFVDLYLDKNIKPGNYKLSIKKEGAQKEISFPVLPKKDLKNSFRGFNSGDIIYLIVPDRFANGDKSNNVDKDFIDHFPSDSPMGRHGGDIKGIINHLDYIKELGATAIWINPLVENNTSVSYHGYAATDLYKIDPRYGTNELYATLADEIHKSGLKLILDHVNNHIGIGHPWVSDLPFHDWLNGTPADHHNTPHANRSIYDIHSDNMMRDSTQTGWFVDGMPDLNQKNPFMAKYLIQNTIWWIENYGVDGIREDTYPYTDQQYLAKWAKIILDEYPEFNIVGEVWMGPPAFRAPYQRGARLSNFNTNLPALMDFGIQEASRDVFTENKSMNEIYEVIAQDNLFSDPNNLVTFLDNHDIERFIYSADGDITKLKLALTLLLTTRGIPQLLYGTEVGLMGGHEHGTLRANFPGGFADSDHNAFTKDDRTIKENEVFDFTKKLIELRKNNNAFTSGKLIHFPPVKELYFYFRISGDKKFFVVINNNNEDQTLRINNLGDYFSGIHKIKDEITGSVVELKNEIIIPAKRSFVFSLN